MVRDDTRASNHRSLYYRENDSSRQWFVNGCLWKPSTNHLFIYLGSSILGRITETVTAPLLPPPPPPPPPQLEIDHYTRDCAAFRKHCVGSLTPYRIYMCNGCETGPAVFRPYPGRLESLTVCKSLCKGSTFTFNYLKTLRVGPVMA